MYWIKNNDDLDDNMKILIIKSKNQVDDKIH